MEYYQKLEWEDKTSLNEKMKAVYNVLDFVSREMSIGRVPDNKIELENNLNSTEKRLSTPLSIAFVKMVEKGEIDEITASEHSEMFLEWHEKITYNIGDFRTYSTIKEVDIGEEEPLKQINTKLYRCLQSHTSQADWTPDVSPALWKEVGIAENGIPEWSQPISSGDAYMLNDEVMYNGNIWVSDYDNNVWEPGVFGWHIKEENEVNG